MTHDNGLIQRHHEHDGIVSTALYSPCERYRYDLMRVWDAEAPRLYYVMLNPSKATELKNDPTIERCQRRAVRLGYGAMRIGNLFAWRETSPQALRKATSPTGRETDRVLREGAHWADAVLCAWGVHGAHEQRGDAVRTLLRDTGAPLVHLGLTRGGHPRHPLYVSYDVTPQDWTV